RPWWWLLDRFQQRIESFIGDLVRFVDDENLVLVPCRLIPDVLAQLTHFIDAAIGSRVDFDDVDCSARGNLAARRALAARRRRGPLYTIQAARQYSCDRRL